MHVRVCKHTIDACTVKQALKEKPSTTPSMTWPSILFRRDTAGVELHVEGVS